MSKTNQSKIEEYVEAEVKTEIVEINGKKYKKYMKKYKKKKVNNICIAQSHSFLFYSNTFSLLPIWAANVNIETDQRAA